MSPIADLLVADKKLSLSCIMTDPCVTPSITSPFNMRGSGDVLGTNEPLTVMEDDIEKLAFHPGTKGPK